MLYLKLRRSRIFFLVGFLLIFVCYGIFQLMLSSSYPVHASSAVYYVATNGSDSNPGTLSQPFATVAEAQTTIRNAHQTGVTVYIRGGVYNQSSTITFTSADSGTSGSPNTYENYPGETPIFRGSVNLPLTTGASGEITEDLAVAGLSGKTITDVYYNGSHQELARTPNYITPNYSATDPYAGSFLYTTSAVTGLTNEFGYDPTKLDPTSWNDATSAKVFMYPGPNFEPYEATISSIDTTAHTITLASNLGSAITANNRFYIEGIPELLDAPGEWYQNTGSNQLNYELPGTVASGDRLSVSYLDTVFTLSGASYMNFQGLDVEEASGAAFYVHNSSNITINGLQAQNFSGSTNTAICAIVCVSGIAINDTVENSRIHDYSGIAISFETGGTSLKTLTPTNNQALNNDIYNNINWHAQYGGAIYFSDGVDVEARNNTIHDMDMGGIGANGNVNFNAEYNSIYNVNRTIQDAGAIGNDPIISGGVRSWLPEGGNIDNNYMNNTGGYGYVNSAWTYGNDSHGIYLDDYSSSFKVYDNIIADSYGECIHNHSGRDNDYYNNICYAGPGTTAMIHFQDEAPNAGYGTLDPKWTEVQDMTSLGYDQAGYLALFPDLANVPENPEQGDAMQNNSFHNNIYVDTANTSTAQVEHSNNSNLDNTFDNNMYWLGTGINPIFNANFGSGSANNNTLAQWQALGFDTHSEVANPLLTDPADGNFTLESNSPALAMGFQQIDQSKIGVQPIAPTVSTISMNTVQKGKVLAPTWSTSDANNFNLIGERYRITKTSSSGTVVQDWTTVTGTTISIPTNSFDTTDSYVICVEAENDATDTSGTQGVWSAPSCTSPTQLATYTSNLTLSLSPRAAGSENISGIEIQFRAPGTQTVLADVTGLSSGTNGTVTITSSTLNTLDPSGTYDVWIKVPGFLARKVANITGLDSVTIPVSNPFLPGDFSGTNTIDISDIVTAIRAYNGGSDTAAQVANTAFGGTTSLANVVDVIHGFNTTTTGDQ